MNTTALELARQLLDQDTRWGQIVDHACAIKNPACHAAKNFEKDIWRPFFSKWLDATGQFDSNLPLDPYYLNEILGDFHHHIYPAARSVGLPDSSFLFPDIGLETNINVSGFTEDFSNFFQSKERGQLWDSIHPFIKMLPYGAAIEGVHEMTYHPAGKKETEEEMLASAMKIHDTIVAAKKGDKKSQATLAGLKSRADAGDPAAVHAMDTANKINNTLNAKAAKSIQRTADAISGYRIGVAVRDHRGGGGINPPGLFGVGPTGNPVRQTAGSAYVSQSGTLTTNPQSSPPVGFQPPPGYYGPYGYPDPSQAGYGQQPPQGYGQMPPYGQQPMPYGMDPYYGTPYPQYGYAPTPYGYTDPYSMGYAPSPYGGGGAGAYSYPGHVPGDDYGPYGYQFSGWGYNHPYRESTELVSRHRLRDYYNVGLNR